jgi:hypothetical protein
MRESEEAMTRIYTSGQTCPQCDEWFDVRRNPDSPTPRYCPFCGAKIEWEGWVKEDAHDD